MPSWARDMALYYMATMVSALRLAVFLNNDQASLAMCPKHVQTVFNLWASMLWSIDSCQKGYLLTSVT